MPEPLSAHAAPSPAVVTLISKINVILTEARCSMLSIIPWWLPLVVAMYLCWLIYWVYPNGGDR